MPDTTLRLVTPRVLEIAPDSSESELRRLYAHRVGELRLGLICSADGKAAGPDGSSRSINGPHDVRVLVALRALADVVLVGGRTARRERYGDIGLPYDLEITRSAANQPRLPDLAIATHGGILPPGLDPERTWIVTTAGSPAAQGASGPWKDRVILAGQDVLSPRSVIKELHERGLPRVLCEGGPELAAQFLARGVVSDVCLTRSPLPGGPDAPLVPEVPASMRLSHRLEGGGFVMERWLSG